MQDNLQARRSALLLKLHSNVTLLFGYVFGAFVVAAAGVRAPFFRPISKNVIAFFRLSCSCCLFVFV